MKAGSLLFRVYMALWCANCVGWVTLLASYFFSFGFAGCDRQAFLISALCEIVQPQFTLIFLFSALSLAPLSLVFLLRLLFFRPLRVHESVSTAIAWVLCVVFVLQIPTS